ncbi:MAG: hypothetical protein NVSMB9_13730 [Isosphaeraceae bacterium]
MTVQPFRHLLSLENGRAFTRTRPKRRKENLAISAGLEKCLSITFEIYGVPRLRAGTGRVMIEASSLAIALDRLAGACPGLDGSIVLNGRILPAYRLSLNGERFISDPETVLADGDVLLLLSADVGG